MDEIINTYPLSNPELLRPLSRQQFYAEEISRAQRDEKPNRAAEVVAVFLFNRHGELIVQKRSSSKAHNAGLLDKSIGGHVRSGDSADYTVMVETVQELQAPSIVIGSEEEFHKTFALLENYLQTVAIIQRVNTGIHTLDKLINGKPVPIANKVHLYFGVYDGTVRPADREAKGILYYTLAELEQEFAQLPSAFTNDLRVLLTTFKEDLGKFVTSIKQ